MQYELLDEIMDNGYPQYTEAKILSEFIKTDAYRMEASQRPPMAVTNAVSWRSEGIMYRTNEVRPQIVSFLCQISCLSRLPFHDSFRCFLMWLRK